MKRGWIIIGLVLLTAVALGILYVSLTPRFVSKVVAGPAGEWIGPTNYDYSDGLIGFIAVVRPANIGDAEPAYVEFTYTWEGKGGPPVVACVDEKLKSTGGRLGEKSATCIWDGRSVGIPAVLLILGFNAYNTQYGWSRNPGGVITLRFKPLSPLERLSQNQIRKLTPLVLGF